MKNPIQMSKMLKIEPFIDALAVPWALAFVSEKTLYITEREGRLRVAFDGKLQQKPLAVIGDVYVEGEAGLMGLALHPDFKKNRLLYLCYTHSIAKPTLRVVRYTELNGALVQERIMLKEIPAAAFHVGCALRFGPDRKLCITTGDATNRAAAADLGSLLGKTLRLNDDGTIPHDNPFVTIPHARKEIYSYWHRNAQGMDWQPRSNALFQTEHGPSGFDGEGGGNEVKIVLAGQNYRWPEVHHKMSKERTSGPLLEYTLAIAPSGASFYSSNLSFA